MLGIKNKAGAALVTALTLGTFCVHGLYQKVGLAWAPTATPDGALPPGQDGAGPAVEDAAGPKQGEVTLTARIDRKGLLAGSEGLLHVALDLAAPAVAATGAARKPTDMLVVLDVSGSMMGDKLAHAKEALHQLINRLSEGDRFCLVTYESAARIVLPLQDVTDPAKARFHRLASSLETAGGTNMSAGLDLALAELRKSRASSHSARMLLLSDGHANEGDVSAEGLASRVREVVRLEDVMSTMGIGDDFNEDLMTSLADIGTGNFYYLSRVEVLGRFFDAELRAAAQSVAQAVELRFEAASGVTLVELGGYPVERSHAGRSAFSVRPGNLYAGQRRTLWATLQAPAAAPSREIPLGRFALRYKKDGVPIEVKAAPLPAVAVVADRGAFEQGIVPALWEDYVATEGYAKTRGALGQAIGQGDEADVDRLQRAYEQNRTLAEKFGSKRVLDKLSAVADEAEQAKAAQVAPAPMRAFRAKETKARARFESRRDAYNVDPSLGLQSSKGQ